MNKHHLPDRTRLGKYRKSLGLRPWRCAGERAENRHVYLVRKCGGAAKLSLACRNLPEVQPSCH